MIEVNDVFAIREVSRYFRQVESAHTLIAHGAIRV